jgi:peptidoglycan/LPS O-acetylase OafA/YrhL
MARRYYEIDLLRFVAALMVVFFHYCFRGHAASNYSDVAFPEVAGAAKFGYLGVDLFFIISGFVIIASARGRTVGSFVVARARRLYPAFWACCTLTAVAIALWGGDRFAATWRQYLGNLPLFGAGAGVRPVDGVYWSLVVELHFYLLVAILLATRSLSRLRPVMAAWLLLSLANVLHPLPGAGHLELDWAPYFIAGTFFFLVSEGDRRPMNFLILAAAFAVALLYQGPRLAEARELFHADFDVTTVGAIEATFFGTMLLIAFGWTRGLRHPVLLTLGALTYPLYLLHQYVGYIVLNAAGPRYDRYLVLTVLVAAMLALAFAIHRLVEVPGSRLLAAALDRVFARLGPAQIKGDAVAAPTMPVPPTVP